MSDAPGSYVLKEQSNLVAEILVRKLLVHWYLKVAETIQHWDEYPLCEKKQEVNEGRQNF